MNPAIQDLYKDGFTDDTYRISSRFLLKKLLQLHGMNISKADAIAHLGKWFDAGTEIRATYTTVTGSLCIVGKIRELADAAVKITGKDCEVLLYFRSTSEYSYEDSRALPTEANKDRVNKYPTVIDIKFVNSDRVQILEFFKE